LRGLEQERYLAQLRREQELLSQREHEQLEQALRISQDAAHSGLRVEDTDSVGAAEETQSRGGASKEMEHPQITRYNSTPLTQGGSIAAAIYIGFNFMKPKKKRAKFAS
jgi:hypothetical protein